MPAMSETYYNTVFLFVYSARHALSASKTYPYAIYCKYRVGNLENYRIFTRVALSIVYLSTKIL